ncbi:hypothetical protein Scep_009970 [Stephania cephalantha]|uniref:Tf2-1-like SH3-like domain-containing protein n=1 Tax=Stephania cephalantha TaxID=152367 RepID=A0AAP0PET2_9MAGN
MEGLYRFGLQGKLVSRYITSFRVHERIGPITYRLELPHQLAAVYNVFHVRILCMMETQF